MKPNKIVLIVAAVVVIAAIAATAVWWTGDGDEAREAGSCSDANATYALEADREGETLELSFEVQSAAPGETWQVALEGPDGALYEGERTTDEDAEIDVDAYAPTATSGDFTATATQGDQTCTATITAG